jgi:hypothetical protein
LVINHRMPNLNQPSRYMDYRQKHFERLVDRQKFANTPRQKAANRLPALLSPRTRMSAVGSGLRRGHMLDPGYGPWIILDDKRSAPDVQQPHHRYMKNVRGAPGKCALYAPPKPARVSMAPLGLRSASA